MTSEASSTQSKVETLSKAENMVEGQNLSFREYTWYMAVQNGVDPIKYQKLIECESEWKLDVHGDENKAYGPLQFHEETFSSFAYQYGLLLDYKNPYDQVKLSTRMIKDGYLNHWSCAYITGWL